MGTNYYHRTNICDCCDRYDETHICKAMVTFQSVNDWGGEWDHIENVVVGSWQQWKERLLTMPGKVFDEYGDEQKAEEFIATVESVPLERRRSHYEWMFANGYRDECVAAPAPGKEWLDADGFSFSGREFS